MENLFQHIPREEFQALQESGQLERILKYCPNQEARNVGGNYLTNAYRIGERIANNPPEIWRNRTNHYLRETYILVGPELQPGLRLTGALLAITGSRSKDSKDETYGSMDSFSSKARSSIIERTKYAAEIITLAQAVPVNTHDIVSWTMQPNKEIFYPTFRTSDVFDDTVPEIQRALQNSPAGKVDLVQLQNQLSLQDEQFAGQEGLNRIQSIIGAIKIHEEVFAPPVQKAV